MIEPTLQIGGGNWANKSDKLLGYHKDGANFYADELTFSRNSLGSYTDANGLIQSMPYNLASYSEQFDNAFWSVDNGSITANSTTAPNGTTTADTFTRTSSTAYLYNGSFNLVIGQFTQSIYAKANASSSIRLELVTSGFSRGAACIFDLSNGTAGTITIYGGVSGFTATIESVGDGWYRCSIGGTIAIADTYFWELSITSGSVYIYGAQLNQGSTALPYFATTTRLNLARVDYKDNINGSLLLESQRTNLITYSEQFDNAAWTKIQISATANDTISPDGTQTAELITVNSGSVDGGVFLFGAWNTTLQTFSLFAKKGNHNRVQLGQASNDWWAIFDLEDGYIVSQDGNLTSSKIVDYGNGWYRCIVSHSNPSATATLSAKIVGENNSVYFWGAQLEVGSYVSSYIKSEGAATTRLADACSKTGISDKINSVEGVLFINTSTPINDSNAGVISVSDGTLSNRCILFYGVGNISARLTVGGVNSLPLSKALTTSSFHKIAARWNATTFDLYVDGVFVSSTANGSFSTNTLTSLQFNAGSGANNFLGNAKSVQVLSYLTDTQMVSLTTL